MPVEIIPAILAKDEKELRRKVESVAGLCEMVQIDVMDGSFVDNVTWADPARLEKMPLPLPYEVHLMVRDPLERLDAWSLAGCQRVLIHAESVDDLAAALREAKSYGMEAGVSINPETSVADIEDAVDGADVVQVMGVHPGRMGQPFEESAIEKVRELREKFPDLLIEVDGGVAVGVARRLGEAGADRLVSGSAVFNSGAPAKALDALRLDVESEDATI
ncbi:MAG TPA: ribulose-phosphate 3-epimerase [Candidatus Baltobacteraceae bacterium]|jgi:ribulose-phosphate 3-epimerase|nr:ribulose-phosphate 3-epimerase [Candidatus Baltobacteraceae bacterium]